jgi:hypothetical protein
MRRYFLPLFIMALLIGTACQPKVNIEKEKEAILAVILEEADGFISMDKDKVYATHMQGGDEIRLEMGVYGYRAYMGWEEIETMIGDYLDGAQIEKVNVSKEDVTIKVAGAGALLACNNVVTWGSGDEQDGYTNIQIVFLEKVNGEWKISFSAYYSKPVEVPGIDESFNASGGL